MSDEKPLVYIAGPYMSDPIRNTRCAIEVATGLYHECQVVPIVPHLSLLWDFLRPHSVEHWYEYDLHILRRCDAVFRISGYSRGADAEVAEAERLGLPIFLNTEELFDWARTWRQK